MIRSTKVRLINNDILIKPHQNVKSDIIVTIDDRMDETNTYEVVKVSDNVKEVKAGDIVVIKFGDHTPPVLLDDGYHAITDESHVLAVIE